MRPGFIIGPYDHTGRFPWWAHRAARGGEMIVPASLAREFQAIDTRDLADFLLIRARSPLTGVFNATGPVPPVTMLDLVEAAASASDTDLNVEVVDDAFLTAQGIESELPLWADDPDWVAWARVDVSQGDRRRVDVSSRSRTRSRRRSRTPRSSPGSASSRNARPSCSRPGTLVDRGAPRQESRVCSSRNAFSPMMTIVTTTAATVVERRLTRPPISARLRQKSNERNQRERDSERQDDLAQYRAPSTD